MRRARSLALHRWPPSARAPPPQAVIKNADMSEELQQDAIDLAAQAMDKFNVEKDIAACACV